MRLIIDGELPSLNEYIRAERATRYAAATMKEKCQKDIMFCIGLSDLRPVEKPVFITYWFFCKNKRKDKDNISAIAHKFIQDALVAAGILQDDGWDNIAGFTDFFVVDKDNPRIEVVIDEVIA